MVTTDLTRTLFTACITLYLASPALGHMEMSWPYPIRSKYNPANSYTIIDYSMTSPLSADGSNYPCKGYQNDRPMLTTVTYDAGSTYNMTLAGSAVHGGGSCQLSLSYDNGATFRVIKSMIGGCPLTPTYDFTIPSFAPNGTALLAWTWQNNMGNREFYMNCAEVNILSSTSTYRKRQTYQSMEDLPYIWKANLAGINDCTTPAGEDPIYPDPGPDVVYGNGKSASDAAWTGDCDSPTPYGQTYKDLGDSEFTPAEEVAVVPSAAASSSTIRSSTSITFSTAAKSLSAVAYSSSVPSSAAVSTAVSSSKLSSTAASSSSSSKPSSAAASSSSKLSSTAVASSSSSKSSSPAASVSSKSSSAATSSADKPSSAATSPSSKASSAATTSSSKLFSAATSSAATSSAATSSASRPSSAATSLSSKPSSAAATSSSKPSSTAASSSSKSSSATTSFSNKPSSAAMSSSSKPSSAAVSSSSKLSSAAASSSSKLSSAVTSNKAQSAAASSTSIRAGAAPSSTSTHSTTVSAVLTLSTLNAGLRYPSTSTTTVTQDCPSFVTITAYGSMTGSVTLPPTAYTVTAAASACTGTSAACPCEQGYNCMAIGTCSWACIHTATNSGTFITSARATSTPAAAAAASSAAAASPAGPPYATGDPNAYLPCMPGTFLCTSNTTWVTCDYDSAASYAYAYPRQVAAGMMCMPAQSMYAAMTGEGQQAQTPQGYYRDDRIVTAQPYGACSAEGGIRCTDAGMGWQMCAEGAWVDMGSVAPGMQCQNGAMIAATRS